MRVKQDESVRNQERDEDPEAKIERELAAALLWAESEELEQPMTVGEAADVLEITLQFAEIALTKRYLDECQTIGSPEIAAHVDGAVHLLREAQRLVDGVRR